MDNTWFAIYVVGCFCAALVATVNVLLLWFTSWVTHANTVRRNLKKLEPPDERSFLARAATVIGTAALEIALSWISVAFGVWRFARTILEVLRDIFSSTPEIVRTLRFPLRNNPNLPRESVWAYMCALAAVAGQPISSASELLAAFDTIMEHYPSFDRGLALRQLQSLRVVEPGVVAEALARFEDYTRANERYEFDPSFT